MFYFFVKTHKILKQALLLFCFIFLFSVFFYSMGESNIAFADLKDCNGVISISCVLSQNVPAGESVTCNVRDDGEHTCCPFFPWSGEVCNGAFWEGSCVISPGQDRCKVDNLDCWCEPFFVSTVPSAGDISPSSPIELNDTKNPNPYEINFTYSPPSDKIPPVSVITAPSEDLWQSGDFPVSVTDSDNGGSGLETCHYHIYDDTAGWTKNWGSRDCNSSFMVSVGPGKDCQTEGEDKCTIYAFSKDSAGNISKPSVRQYSIDSTKPVSSISSPGESSCYNADFSVSVVDSDTSSGLKECRYWVWDVGVSGWTKGGARACNSPFSITVGPGKDCRTEGLNKCYIYAYSKDNAGNASEYSIRKFSIDWTDPVAVLIPNSASGSPGLEVQFTLDGTDNIGVGSWSFNCGNGVNYSDSGDPEGITKRCTYNSSATAILTINDSCKNSNKDSSPVTITVSSCFINGTSYSNGDYNPSNKCQKCDVSRSINSWTNVPDGTDPGGGCSASWNSCDSTCVRKGGDGACYSGACDTTHRTENIPSGYVCTGSGASVPVSSSKYCRRGEDCDGFLFKDRLCRGRTFPD